MASAFFTCLQKSCNWYQKLEYSGYQEIFKHYYNKGREVLIQLALEYKVSTRPYSESTYILADKLVKLSKVTVN